METGEITTLPGMVIQSRHRRVIAVKENLVQKLMSVQVSLLSLT